MTYQHVPHGVWGTEACTLPIDWYNHGQRVEFHGAKLTIRGGQKTMCFHSYSITVDEGTMPVAHAEELARVVQRTRLPQRPYDLQLTETEPGLWLLTFDA